MVEEPSMEEDFIIEEGTAPVLPNFEPTTDVTLMIGQDFILALEEPFDDDGDEVTLTVNLGQARMFTKYSETMR